jgi:alkylation response protein AidB-like acyl-CoA dehydrogenase
VFASVRRNNSITHAERAALRMCGTHVIRECADVLDLAYKVAGSTGIYQDHTLQRRFQDMHVITQHVQARESYFALLGRYAISGNYETGPMT